MLRVVRVLAPNPGPYTLEGTNTWVVGEEPTVVIDPGPDDEGHLDEVARAAGRVAHVLVTHDHEDHAPGALRFAERTGAPVSAVRLAGASHLRDGQTIQAGALSLKVVSAPGHSADHVVFFEPASLGLFTGDAVLGRGTSLVDPDDGDLGKYLASLRRMLDLRPRTIYPGHGPVVTDAGGKLREYLDHRLERESQVLTVLAVGPSTVAAIVASIYQGYPDDVLPLAERTILAHLLKLESEGRAERKSRGKGTEWSASEPRTCARCGRPIKGRGRYCSSCSLILLQEDAG